jgi:hypothetical protein
MTALLIVAAAIVGYALFVLASPKTGCPKCRGFGTKGRRRRRPCSRCGGTGIRFRPGAPLLYRAISGYRRHRANGNLTLPPTRPPRHRP